MIQTQLLFTPGLDLYQCKYFIFIYQHDRGVQRFYCNLLTCSAHFLHWCNLFFFQDVATHNNQSLYTQGTCSFLCLLVKQLHLSVTRHIYQTDFCKLSMHPCLFSILTFKLLCAFRHLWLWCCQQFPSWLIGCSQWWRVAVCRMESCAACHQHWASACCITLVFIWLQPAGHLSSDSGLPSRPHPDRWCVYADSVPQLHHADLHTHATAH